MHQKEPQEALQLCMSEASTATNVQLQRAFTTTQEALGLQSLDASPTADNSGKSLVCLFLGTTMDSTVTEHSAGPFQLQERERETMVQDQQHTTCVTQANGQESCLDWNWASKRALYRHLER